MVKGAAEGYERSLELVGTGYRAEVKGKILPPPLMHALKQTASGNLTSLQDARSLCPNPWHSVEDEQAVPQTSEPAWSPEDKNATSKSRA